METKMFREKLTSSADVSVPGKTTNDTRISAEIAAANVRSWAISRFPTPAFPNIAIVRSYDVPLQFFLCNQDMLF